MTFLTIYRGDDYEAHLIGRVKTSDAEYEYWSDDSFTSDKDPDGAKLLNQMHDLNTYSSILACPYPAIMKWAAAKFADSSYEIVVPMPDEVDNRIH